MRGNLHRALRRVDLDLAEHRARVVRPAPFRVHHLIGHVVGIQPERGAQRHDAELVRRHRRELRRGKVIVLHVGNAEDVAASADKIRRGNRRPHLRDRLPRAVLPRLQIVVEQRAKSVVGMGRKENRAVDRAGRLPAQLEILRFVRRQQLALPDLAAVGIAVRVAALIGLENAVLQERDVSGRLARVGDLRRRCDVPAEVDGRERDVLVRFQVEINRQLRNRQGHLPILHRDAAHVAKGIDHLHRVTALHADVERYIGGPEVLHAHDRTVAAFKAESEQHLVSRGAEIDRARVLAVARQRLARAQGQRRGVRSGRVPRIGRHRGIAALVQVVVAVVVGRNAERHQQVPLQRRADRLRAAEQAPRADTRDGALRLPDVFLPLPVLIHQRVQCGDLVPPVLGHDALVALVIVHRDDVTGIRPARLVELLDPAEHDAAGGRSHHLRIGVDLLDHLVHRLGFLREVLRREGEIRFVVELVILQASLEVLDDGPQFIRREILLLVRELDGENGAVLLGERDAFVQVIHGRLAAQPHKIEAAKHLARDVIPALEEVLGLRGHVGVNRRDADLLGGRRQLFSARTDVGLHDVPAIARRGEGEVRVGCHAVLQRHVERPLRHLVLEVIVDVVIDVELLHVSIGRRNGEGVLDRVERLRHVRGQRTGERTEQAERHRRLLGGAKYFWVKEFRVREQDGRRGRVLGKVDAGRVVKGDRRDPDAIIRRDGQQHALGGVGVAAIAIPRVAVMKPGAVLEDRFAVGCVLGHGVGIAQAGVVNIALRIDRDRVARLGAIRIVAIHAGADAGGELALGIEDENLAVLIAALEIEAPVFVDGHVVDVVDRLGERHRFRRRAAGIEEENLHRLWRRWHRGRGRLALGRRDRAGMHDGITRHRGHAALHRIEGDGGRVGQGVVADFLPVRAVLADKTLRREGDVDAAIRGGGEAPRPRLQVTRDVVAERKLAEIIPLRIELLNAGEAGVGGRFADLDHAAALERVEVALRIEGHVEQRGELARAGAKRAEDEVRALAVGLLGVRCVSGSVEAGRKSENRQSENQDTKLHVGSFCIHAVRKPVTIRKESVDQAIYRSCRTYALNKTYCLRSRLNFSTSAVAVGKSAGQQPMVVQKALLKWLSEE